MPAYINHCSIMMSLEQVNLAEITGFSAKFEQGKISIRFGKTETSLSTVKYFVDIVVPLF